MMNGEGDGLTDQGLVCSIIDVVLVCHGEEAAEPKLKAGSLVCHVPALTCG